MTVTRPIITTCSLPGIRGGVVNKKQQLCPTSRHEAFKILHAPSPAPPPMTLNPIGNASIIPAPSPSPAVGRIRAASSGSPHRIRKSAPGLRCCEEVSEVRHPEAKVCSPHASTKCPGLTHPRGNNQRVGNRQMTARKTQMHCKML